MFRDCKMTILTKVILKILGLPRKQPTWPASHNKAVSLSFFHIYLLKKYGALYLQQSNAFKVNAQYFVYSISILNLTYSSIKQGYSCALWHQIGAFGVS